MKLTDRTIDGMLIAIKPNRDFDLNFSTFEKILKSTKFKSLHFLT
ncbi:hypothetical protein Plhal304r1_c027g0090291 [Plasmopara halstedii]